MMVKREQKAYIPYLDLLRVVAIFAVVLLHSASQEWARTDHHTVDWQILNFYNGISRFCVPLFVMISGVLFLGGKAPTLEKLHKKKIFRIMVAFVFWSFVYATIDYLSGRLNIFGAITSFLRGPMHLWFCCMIIGLYLITPFLRMINESPYRDYFMRLCIIFSMLIPVGLKLLKEFVPILGGALSVPIGYMSFSFTGGYVFYYILGAWLQEKVFTRKQRMIVYALSILGFFCTVYLTARYIRYSGQPDELFFGNLTVNVMLEAAGIFVFAKYCDFDKMPAFTKRLIQSVSECSFGIYLIHVLILKTIYPFVMEKLGIIPAVGIPLVTIITFAISYILIFCIRQIPVFKRYVV